MADDTPHRIAQLTVCDAEGTLLGVTDDFDVPSEYWSHVESLVPAAKRELDLDVTVLRLLAVERGAGGGTDRTTYLAEATRPPHGLSPATRSSARALRPEEFRMPWAQPGGPAAQLTWAEEQLEAQGIQLAAPPIQIRTWNLSSIWRLATSAGTVWLKAVPPFFAHEGAMIERFAGYAVPRLLARGEGIVLLGDVAGEDLYQPPDESAIAMIDAFMEIQRGPGADIEELLALGLPDWRVTALAEPGARVLDLRSGDLADTERRALETLIGGLGTLARDLAGCGIPDSLVHGDFHPGNARGGGVDVTILDWGDTGVGHPLLDAAAFTERMPERQRAVTLAHWSDRWRIEVPGSDPERAAELIGPVGALRQAIIYRHFFEHVEADERVYHQNDDLLWLRRTAALLEA